MAEIELVIKIPEEDYKEVQKDTYSGTAFENRVFSAIANGIPLPQTNGEVIKAMFKPYTIDEDFDSYYTFDTIKDWNSGKWCTFPKDWWKAPYKGDEDETNN